MKRDPVSVDRDLRGVVLEAVVARLIEFGCEPIVASMGAKHVHVLARFERHDPRIKVGIAKQFATKTLKAHCSAVGFDLGLKEGEGIWGKRTRAEPIKNRPHQVETVPYIAGHELDGAYVWIAPTLAHQKAALLRLAREKREKKAHR